MVETETIKAQILQRLNERRAEESNGIEVVKSGGRIRAGDFGPNLPTAGNGIILAVAGGAIVLGLGVGWALFGQRGYSQESTGNAQIDLAFQMLANQQGINDRLLQGQQELSAQIIQASAEAKNPRPNINCFFVRVCPGDSPTDWAIVGEGVATAKVSPPQQPQVEPYQPDSQQIAYSPDQVWAAHYRDMQVQQPDRFNQQWQECIRQNWLPVTSKLNCKALSRQLNQE